MTSAADPSKVEGLRRDLESRLATLPDKPAETAHSTLATLWHMAAGRSLVVEEAARTPLPTLSESEHDRLMSLIDQRISGTPLAHITGVQRFMGLDLLSSEDALIPRQETEALVRGALDVLAAMPGDQPLTVIDVCTGSGNVALAIAHHAPRTRVFASDLSDRAVTLARRNATKLGLADRVTFATGDLLAPFETTEFIGHVDLLVANPPYISTARVERMPAEISGHEPRLAFDGGPLGVQILTRLIRESPRFVRSGGWFGFEMGLGQGPSVVKRLRAQPGIGEIREIRDAAGATRAVLAQR